MSRAVCSKDQLGRRLSHRLPVVLPALIRSGEMNFTAKMTNIARDGARLETSAPVLAGANVTVCCGSIDAAGRVIWRNAGVMGVNFDTRLSEAVVEEQVARSAALEILRSRQLTTTVPPPS